MYAVGDLIITGISGTTLTDAEKRFIEEEKIAGVIIFSRNYENPEQLAKLINSIQALRSEWPLFIGVDHEGGRVFRFRQHFTQFPSMFSITKHNSPKLCFEVHQVMAEELAACGINLSFSPVCDLLTNKSNNVIGDRSFGDDPEEVSKYISAAVRGLEANQVISCAKHFPGHGDTESGEKGDSHFELPSVQTEFATLMGREMIPFKKAIKSRVEMMMMAHLMVPAIDESRPTTFSPRAYQLLREELKYHRIIISDDMEMKAVAKHYPEQEAPIMTINAGCDLLIYNHMEKAQIAVAALHEALKTKKIKKDDFEDKQRRIVDCKKRNLSNYQPIYIPDIAKKMNTPMAQELLQKLKS
ncbi:MAG: beta-N-acetylhexosaminidase [Oligoflexia bacterium]|nr:beta-N-acetylhexosaminidase [Oligoflexia bacterium]MBF0364375.1 beta-N-acetylhexosaminidase [Oligoflexia bacterium]